MKAFLAGWYLVTASVQPVIVEGRFSDKVVCDSYLAWKIEHHPEFKGVLVCRRLP